MTTASFAFEHGTTKNTPVPLKDRFKIIYIYSRLFSAAFPLRDI